MHEGCIAKTNGEWRSCSCGCEHFVIISKTEELNRKLMIYRHNCICLSCGNPTFNIYLPASNVIVVSDSFKDFILELYAYNIEKT